MKFNKKNIAVIGIGKFGESVVRQLVKLKKFVLAIDIEEKNLIKVANIAKTKILDASNIEALIEIGVQNFNTVIVATSNNIEIISALKDEEINVNNIIAKAKSKIHERILKQLNVNFIIKPEIEAGIRIALIATDKNFIKFAKSIQNMGDGYVMGETSIVNSNFIDKPIKSLKSIFKDNLSIVSIKRENKIIIPTGEKILKKNDVVMLIGKTIHITKIIEKFNNFY